MPEIRHIVVVMMENHSFDNILGMVGHRFPALRGLDGLTLRGGRLRDFNRDPAGRRVFAQHAAHPVSAARQAAPGLERQPPLL